MSNVKIKPGQIWKYREFAITFSHLRIERAVDINDGDISYWFYEIDGKMDLKYIVTILTDPIVSPDSLLNYRKVLVDKKVVYLYDCDLDIYFEKVS